MVTYGGIRKLQKLLLCSNGTIVLHLTLLQTLPCTPPNITIHYKRHDNLVGKTHGEYVPSKILCQSFSLLPSSSAIWCFWQMRWIESRVSPSTFPQDRGPAKTKHIQKHLYNPRQDREETMTTNTQRVPARTSDHPTPSDAHTSQMITSVSRECQTRHCQRGAPSDGSRTQSPASLSGEVQHIDTCRLGMSCGIGLYNIVIYIYSETMEKCQSTIAINRHQSPMSIFTEVQIV